MVKSQNFPAPSNHHHCIENLLITPGEWEAKGFFSNYRISQLPATALFRVYQHAGLFILESSIQVRVPEIKVLTAVIEVLPFSEDESHSLMWTHIPNIGKVSGTIMLAGQAIMAHYQSLEHEIEGLCTFVSMGHDHVLAFGQLNKGGKNKGTWSMDFIRKSHIPT